MSNTVQRRRIYDGFDKLPPRVIIFRILVFHLMDVSKNRRLKEFELFGYYKLDRTRSIWFLFQSIFVRTRDHVEENCVDLSFPQIDFKKIYFLRIRHGDMERRVLPVVLPVPRDDNSISVLVGQVAKMANYMYSLRRLQIVDISSFRREDIMHKMISNENCFPKLNNLTLVFGNSFTFNGLAKWNSKRLIKLREKIEVIQMMFFELNSMRRMGIHGLYPHNANANSTIIDNFLLFEDKALFPLLKTVNISYFSSSKVTEIFAPNLEQLDLSKCVNMRIVPGENLKALGFGKVENYDDVKEVFVRSRRLVEFGINFRVNKGLFRLPWFMNRSINPLSLLTVLKLDHYVNESELGFQFFKKIFPTLKEVYLHNCGGLPLELFTQFSKRVEKLSIGLTDVLVREDVLWSCSRNLKSLKINNIENCEVSNLFCGIKTFSSLEELEITGRCYYVSFKKWNLMKNLKHFRIDIPGIHHSIISDRFFAENSFENLESLALFYSVWKKEWNPLSGDSWKTKRFEKLRSIEFELDLVCDDLFRTIEFPALVELKIMNSVDIRGSGWKEMKNLRELCLIRVNNFSEEVFQEMEGKGVEVITNDKW